jgi:hypothetical protein
MSKITETTRAVKVTDLLQEYPPSILVSETVIGPAGKLRLFTQKVQVLDADLWARLMAEVKKGDTISVTVKTIWPDEGRYYTSLASFTIPGTSSEAHSLHREPLKAVGNVN